MTTAAGTSPNWLTETDNRYFARAAANRVWAHLMGRGIVEPIDDFRDSNPPSNHELLDALAAAFARSGYRIKPLIRMIMNSTDLPVERRTSDSHFTPRRRPRALFHIGGGEDSHGRADPRCNLRGDRHL